MNKTIVYSDNIELDEAYINIAKDERIFKGSLKDSAPIIIRKCAEVLNSNRVSIWLLSKDRTELVCFSHYSYAEDKFEEISVTLTQHDLPEYFNALNNSRVIDAQYPEVDLRTKELTDSYLIPLKIKSLLNATIRNNGNLQGVFCCEIQGEPRSWTSDEKIFITSIADLVSQRLLLGKLKKSQAYLLSLYEVSPLGIMFLDGRDNVFIDGNPAMFKMFGVKKEEILGKSPLDFSPECQPCGELSSSIVFKHVAACIKGDTPTFEWVHKRLDGSEFDAEISLGALETSSSSNLLFAVVSDISRRKEAERDLEYRASRDSLTGLLNRESLYEYLDQLISYDQRVRYDQREERNSKIAILLLDLNHFKDINDTFGHIAGDEALKSIAKMLKQYIDSINGSLFRLGGDEFIVVAEKEKCSKPLSKLPELIKNILNETIYVNGLDVKIGASIGASLYPNNGVDSHELLRCADVAMYFAKTNVSQVYWYEVKDDINSQQRLVLKTEFDKAIENEQLRLHFQPKIDIQTQEIVGFEALLRWQHPELGFMLPEHFLPSIEMTEMIHHLTDWVLKNAIDSLIHLGENGYSLPIAINVSARNILNMNFIDGVQERLLKSKIEPSLLEIEITETALITNLQQASQSLSKLDAFGISIALDDFGTGYSSLCNITNLSLKTIKIDPSFIQGMNKSKSDFVVVSSIINLARSLSLNVVAEGVEDQQTFDALKKLHCNQMQGFFIAEAMEMTGLKSWLKKNELIKTIHS